jgi:hypothetical protein
METARIFYKIPGKSSQAGAYLYDYVSWIYLKSFHNTSSSLRLNKKMLPQAFRGFATKTIEIFSGA